MFRPTHCENRVGKSFPWRGLTSSRNWRKPSVARMQWEEEKREEGSSETQGPGWTWFAAAVAAEINSMRCPWRVINPGEAQADDFPWSLWALIWSLEKGSTPDEPLRVIYLWGNLRGTQTEECCVNDRPALFKDLMLQKTKTVDTEKG